MQTEEITLKLGELNGKMDLVLDTLKDHRKMHDVQDDRLNALERNDSFQWGGTGIITVIFAYVMFKLKEHNIL